MPIVAMPDGTQVQFPDNMPDGAIRTLISKKFPDAMTRAREELAHGLREGKRGDQETYQTAAFRTNQGVPAAGATDAAVQGMTGGFMDEISAAGRAPIDMLKRGESFDEAYQHNLAAERDRLEQYRKTNPVASTAAEVAGGFAFPASKTAAPIKQAVAQGVVFGAGNSEGDLAQRASDAATGGAVSGALGAGVSAVGRALAGKAPSATPTSKELKEYAGELYNSPVVKELELAPATVKDAVTAIRAKLDADGFDEIIAPKAHAILKRLEAEAPAGAVITGQNLRSVQKTLGKASSAIDREEKAGAVMALKEFNKFLEDVPAAGVVKGDAAEFSRVVKEANANYSPARIAQDLDKRTVDAQRRAEASNSGMNVANTIRQRMATVVENPKLNRGMTAEELAQAEQLVRGSKAENLIRKAGNIAGGGGGLGTLAAGAAGIGAAGAYSGDPQTSFMGLALPAFGFAMRGMGNRMTLKNAERLSEAIRARAPLASATTKFEERVAQFHANRNAKTAAAATLAARNLSTNLRGAGFNISPGDLMRSLQGPMSSRAEDEQQ